MLTRPVAAIISRGTRKIPEPMTMPTTIEIACRAVRTRGSSFGAPDCIGCSVAEPLCEGLGVVDNLGEGFGHEAGTADERAVDVRLSHEIADVFRLDGPTIEDARGFCGLFAAGVGELVADDAVGFFRDIRRCRGAGADGPDGLVGDDET